MRENPRGPSGKGAGGRGLEGDGEFYFGLGLEL